MNSALNRRSFLKRSTLAAGAVSAGGLLPVPNLLAAASAGDKLKVVQIGCGGRGMSSHIDWVVTRSKDNLVAIVDADEKRHAAVKKWLEGKGQDPAKVRTFTDYRVMFDKMGKEIDVVCVATPNHHHALPAMMAMQLGKGVFC
jgi:predicted dehydrogenase